MLDFSAAKVIIENALREDIGNGDITTALTVPTSARAKAVLTAKENGVLAGLPVAELAFDILHGGVSVACYKNDGESFETGDTLAVFAGPARKILAGERVILNFIQRLSGVATATKRFVSLATGTKARIVDTRKTTPGIRLLEKYAVRIGGGFNHRFGLYDGILIKDNHIVAAGGITNAVSAAKTNAPHTLKIEVEVKSLEELREALAIGADAVLLDNMAPEKVREAVEITAGQAILEVSGGINENNIRSYAETGVDIISIGALTHSAKAIDISLDFIPEADWV